MAPRTNYKWHVIGNFYRDNNLSAEMKLTTAQWGALAALTPYWPSGSPAEHDKLEGSAKKYIIPDNLAVLSVDDSGQVVWHPHTPVLQEPTDDKQRGPAQAFELWKHVPVAYAAAAATDHVHGAVAGPSDADPEHVPSAYLVAEPQRHQQETLEGGRAIAKQRSGPQSLPEQELMTNYPDMPGLQHQQHEQAKSWSVRDTLPRKEAQPSIEWEQKLYDLQNQLRGQAEELSNEVKRKQYLHNLLRKKETELSTQAQQKRIIHDQLSQQTAELAAAAAAANNVNEKKKKQHRLEQDDLATLRAEHQDLQTQFSATQHSNTALSSQVRLLQEQKDKAFADASIMWESNKFLEAKVVEMEEKMEKFGLF